jgi:glycosyltransferase involved in cell wall biosynthesis
VKILFPFVGDSVGGSHISSIELIKELINMGLEVQILLHIENGPLSQLLKSHGLTYRVLPTKKLAGESPNLLKILFAIIKNSQLFIKFLSENNIDIVHGNDLRVNLSWSIPTKISGRFYIWHQRVMMSNSILWRLIPYISDHFIAISQTVIDAAPINLKDSSKSIVWNPFNINIENNKKDAKNFLYTKYDIPKKSIIVGYIGRLVEYKDVDSLISFFADFQHLTNSRVFLAIFGDGNPKYLEKLNKLIVKKNLQKTIKLYGYSYQPDLVIAGFDILVACSPRDAFGRTIVEAMLQKTPVLASASGGHTEIIDDGINGFLYDPKNSKEFNTKLIQLIPSQVSNLMTNHAFSFAKNKFSSQAHANDIFSIYSKFY